MILTTRHILQDMSIKTHFHFRHSTRPQRRPFSENGSAICVGYASQKYCYCGLSVIGRLMRRMSLTRSHHVTAVRPIQFSNRSNNCHVGKINDRRSSLLRFSRKSDCVCACVFVVPQSDMISLGRWLQLFPPCKHALHVVHWCTALSLQHPPCKHDSHIAQTDTVAHCGLHYTLC